MPPMASEHRHRLLFATDTAHLATSLIGLFPGAPMRHQRQRRSWIPAPATGKACPCLFVTLPEQVPAAASTDSWAQESGLTRFRQASKGHGCTSVSSIS